MPANAYEAAQHILQAINFGGLFKMPDEENPSDSTIPETPSVALSNPAAVPQTKTDVPPVDHRAELQALLALLAAQLAEVAHADEDDGGAPKDKELPAAVVTDPHPPIMDAPPAVNIAAWQQEEEEDSDEDMEEVI
jgi:hypothetical protein